MLLDAIFRHEPLENPKTGIIAEMAETDGLFRSGTYVNPETGRRLFLYHRASVKYCPNAVACDEKDR